MNKNKAIYYIIQIYFVFFSCFFEVTFIFAMYNSVTMIEAFTIPGTKSVPPYTLKAYQRI